MNLAAWDRINTDPLTLEYLKYGVKIPFEKDCETFCIKNYHIKSKKEREFLKNNVKAFSNFLKGNLKIGSESFRGSKI